MSISGSDTTIALEGPEAEGHPDELVPSNQARLTALMREINDVCERVEVGGRTTSRKFGPQRMGATKSSSSASTTTFPNSTTY